MFKGSDRQSELNGILNAGSHIRGELHFEDEFLIYGKVTGSVVSDGELIIGEEGEIEGDIVVRRVQVSGTVRGKLKATERIEITSTGEVFAELETPSLFIEDGAFFEGSCSMSRKPKRSKEPSPENVTKMPSRTA